MASQGPNRLCDKVGDSALFARPDGTYFAVRLVGRERPNGPHGTGEVRQVTELGRHDSKVAAMAAFRRRVARD